MIRYKWLRLCESAASAAVGFLLLSACAVSGIGAQSPEAAVAGSPSKTAPPSAFLVAPSFPLGYAPSSVATGDLRRNGKLDLVTADYATGKITVFLGQGKGEFARGAEYFAGSHPSSLIVADIDGDGRPDVLVANESESAISVLRGAGDGTLQPRQSYAVGFNPSFIAAGDFDGNGRVDVAVAGKSGSRIAILLNDGNGGLKNPIFYSYAKAPAALTAADLNHDGHFDLALANQDGTVSVLLGEGAGKFRPLPPIDVASNSLSSIVAGDFNRDGKIDLAVTQPGQKLVSVLIGKGDGTFAAPVSYRVGNEPTSALVTDLTGDGFADLIVMNKSSNTFSVLTGNGDGTFKDSQDFVAGNAPLAAVAGDFYGNGHIDLAIINHASQSVSVPPGTGDGTFMAGRSYTAGIKPIAIASGNLNGDRHPGLVIANYCGSDAACKDAGSVSVFLADEKGVYRHTATYPVGAGPVAVALADLNGDKILDIVALNRLDKTASVLLGLGDGTFRQQMTFPLAGAPISLAAGSLSKNGKLNLAVLEDCGAEKCSQPGSVEVLNVERDGSLQSESTYAVGLSPASIALGDIRGTKNLDIVVANRCGRDASCQSGGAASVLMNDGTGHFKPGKDIALGNSPSSVALARLTGSGLDLVVSRSADNTVAVLRGNGDGTFQAAVPHEVGNQPRSLVVADFNGDGKTDLAVANSKDSTVSVLFGRGDGTFQAAATLPVGVGPEALTAIGSTSSRHASLATANGNSVSSTPGTEFTVVTNLLPDPPLTSFVLAPSPVSSNVNDPVVLTATLTGSGATPPQATTTNPASLVTFSSNGVALSDCTNVSVVVTNAPSSISTSTCTTHLLTAGSDSLVAAYAGDGFYGADTTSPVIQPVTALPATIGLTSSAVGSVQTGTSVTFTAQVAATALTPVSPTGTVAFLINGATSADCPSITMTSASPGAAACTTSSLEAPADIVTATYSDASAHPNFIVSPASATFGQSVTKGGVGTNVSSSLPSSSVNQTVTFTASVTPLSGTVKPTGNVKFTASGIGTPLCTAAGVNPANGQATCAFAFSSESAGITITATYSGDQNYSAGLPGTTTQVVTPSGTATTVVSTPNPSTVNQSVTFTATVTPAFSAGAGVPTGTVVFKTTSATLCTVTLAGGTAPVCNATFSAKGSNPVVAAYSGDADFGTSTSAPNGDVQTVNAAPTSIVLTSSPSSSSVDQLVTLTATIDTNGGTTVPQGTMVYKDTLTGSTLCTATLTSTGIAPACPFAFATPGTHTITATFTTGNGNFSSGVSSVLSQPVTQTTTTTSVSSSPNPSAVNQSVVFSATVTPAFAAGTAVPTGTVVYATTGPAATLCTVTLSNGIVPVCNFTFTAKSSKSVVATYTSGDSNFASSASNPDVQVIGTGATSIVLSSSPTSSVIDQPVTFTATINTNGGSTQPQGTMVYKDTSTGTTLCSVTLTSAGIVPACPFPFTTVATHTVTATFTSSNSNFSSGVSSVLSEVVSEASTSISVLSSPDPSAVNQPVAFTATLAPAFTGSVKPTGMVLFSDTSTSPATPLCTVAVASNGSVPVCNFAFTSSGTNNVVATFTSADSNFTGSASSADVQNVGSGATTVVLTSLPKTSVVNQLVTLTASINLTSSGSAVPQGTMTYTDTLTGTTLCMVTLSSTGSIPSCAYAFPSVGTHTVTASFATSNSNFKSGVSSALSQVVSQAATTTTVTSTPNPSTVNQSVTFTATVIPAFTGATNPTGSVAFTYTLSGGAAVTLCATAPVSTASGTTTAQCAAPLPSTGSYTIAAAYLGDNQFFATGQGGSTSVTEQQKVNAQILSVKVTSPGASVVNQQVTFTVTVAPMVAGTPPSGTVALTDTLTATTFCTGVAITVPSGSSTGTATCNYTPLTAASHPITAAFTSGNTNYANTTSPVFAQEVDKTSTTVTIVSSSSANTNVATQQVTFTATVTPSQTGMTFPTGSVAFSSTDGTLTATAGCKVAPVTSVTGTGTSVASCSAQFPASIALSLSSETITAIYSGDTNFVTNTDSLAETVQNFALANSVTSTLNPASTSGSVTLTQGYATATKSSAGADPFNPTTVKLVVTSSGGFTASLKATCAVTNTQGASVTDPSCSLGDGSNEADLSGTSGTVLIYTLSASPAARLGAYNVAITAEDGSALTLSHAAAPLTLYIVGVANTLSLAQGASGTENASFNTAPPASGKAPTSLGSFTCGTVVTSDTKTPIAAGQLSCTGPASVPVGSGDTTTVPITISTAGHAAAQLERAGTIYAAAFLGLPLVALLGWVGGGKSRRRNLFRFLAMVLLLAAGISYATGCGGSFTYPKTPAGTGIGAGNYLVQVVGTDQNGVKYYAVVPLAVSQN
jgi:hypothetical protein